MCVCVWVSFCSKLKHSQVKLILFGKKKKKVKLINICMVNNTSSALHFYCLEVMYSLKLCPFFFFFSIMNIITLLECDCGNIEGKLINYPTKLTCLHNFCFNLLCLQETNKELEVAKEIKCKDLTTQTFYHT